MLGFEKVQKNIFLTSCTRKLRSWYFKRCGLKNYWKRVRENVVITSCTRTASNWYIKRCSLKKVPEKERGNVLECHVLENQETNISNNVVSKITGKSTGKCFITSCTRKATNGYFKRCVLKKYGENVRGNVFITSCTLKASNWYFVRCHLKKYGKMFYYVMDQKTKKLIFKCWGLKKYRKIFF